MCSSNSTNQRLNNYMKQNEIKSSYSDSISEISLTFDPWEITNGGSGKLLRIKTPVKNGEMILNNNTIKLDGICPLIEVQLDFFNDGSQTNIKDLKFNFLVEGKNPGDLTNGAVTIINSDLNGIITNQSDLIILKGLLSKMFIENKHQYSYIFAEMNISPGQKWMKPEKYRYTYVDMANNNNGFLAIFSVVTNRDISNLQDGVDTKILNNSNDTFLLLSERMFLENIILPELPSTLGNGAKPTDFKLNKTSETTGEIVNVNYLNADSVTWGGVSYYPKITKLKIKVKGSTMEINADGYFKFADYDQFFWTTSVNKFFYNKDTKKAYFIPDDNPSYRYEENIPWWAWILGVAIIPIIIAVCNAVAKSVAKSMAFQANNNFLTNIKTDVISWNGVENIDVQNVILDVSFGLQGNAK